MKHLAALDVAHVAFVAHISESKVVIAASFAGPVSNSLCWLLARDDLSWGDLLHGFSLGLSVNGRLLHVSWHTIGVFVGLALLASVALLSTLEVVVLALGAFPSSFGELEVTSSWGWGLLFD